MMAKETARMANVIRMPGVIKAGCQNRITELRRLERDGEVRVRMGEERIERVRMRKQD